jgi:hypothetical protein
MLTAAPCINWRRVVMVEDSLSDVIKNNKRIEPLDKKKGQRVFTDRQIPAKIKGIF